MPARPALREDRYIVRIDGDNTPYPVVAWSDDGAALVLGRDGHLVPAADLGTIAHIVERGHQAVVPAQSGTFARIHPKGGSAMRVPVAYWLVDHEGWASPVPLSNGTYLSGPLADDELEGVEWDDLPAPRR